MKTVLHSAIALLLFLLLSCKNPQAQQHPIEQKPSLQLIVVISYDQMRGDYMLRWQDYFSEKGFNRLRNEGAYFPNAAYGHASTLTGPGHATLLTGCYPHKSGIVANDFYDIPTNKNMYCCEDTQSPLLLVGDSASGRSPRTLQAATLGDILKKKHPQSKVIGVSGKDRASILMAGRDADLALWYHDKLGAYTTSTYFSDTLPTWVVDHNTNFPKSRFAGTSWKMLLPDSAYHLPDNVPWEPKFFGQDNRFPHKLLDTSDTKYSTKMHSWMINVMPFAVEDLFLLAKTALQAEQLGVDTIPDILCIGVSATDKLGHTFGPDSREVFEMYLHCDRILGEFIDHLDSTIGREHYELVISADHGVGPVPEYAESIGKPAGRVLYGDMLEDTEAFLEKTFPIEGNRWVERVESPSIFLSKEALSMMEKKSIRKSTVTDSLAAFLMRYNGISTAIATYHFLDSLATDSSISEFHGGNIAKDMVSMIRTSFHPERCGDVMAYLAPYHLFGQNSIASHGTPHFYDRSVALAFFGSEVVAQTFEEEVSPVIIAPTLAEHLEILLDETDGEVINLREKAHQKP